MRRVLQSIFSAFVNFIYPSNCLHCAHSMNNRSGAFCPSCLSQLELILPSDRCPYCFSVDYDPEKRRCYPCYMRAPVLKKYAAVFDYHGPAATLVTKMKYSNQPYLSKGAAAYMAVQLMKLDWPVPDLIVPVPLTLSHRISRGYNQSLLLAHALGNMLNCPVRSILNRRWLDYSQTGMSRSQREALDKEAFSLRNRINIRDQVILLIDDVSTTGQTMNCCAEALYTGFPEAVYGLTLCKGI